MAMMARMRSLAPAFIIGVGGLFVLFMVLSDSKVMEVFGARTNNVGSVNGRDITYQEYANLIDRAIQNQKAQTGQDIPEEQMEQFREQVWDGLITQILTEQALEKFGITVTDDEIRDVILGDDPPEFLKRSFIDSLGRFNRELYNQALFDPRNKEPLVQAEDAVRQQLLSQKLQSYLTATINVSEQEIIRKFIDQNIQMTAEFTLVDLNSIEDKEVKVTDEDLKNYYDEHPEKFQQEAQRKIKYVFFRNAPSKSDSDGVIENLTNVFQKVKNDTSFKSNVEIYSEVPYSRDTTNLTSLPEPVREVILKQNPGSVFGPVAIPNGFAIYKLVATVPSSEPLVKASHILIQSSGDDVKDKAEADRIYNEAISGKDFSALARQYSKDPGSALRGGDLGWFGKGQMVKEFEDACFNGGLNVVQKPVKTTYGYHIIKVTDRINKKFVVERIVNSVKMSGMTRDNLYNQANDFSYLAEKYSFEKEAENSKYPVQESQPLTEKNQFIPGIGTNKGMIDFIFDNGINTVSPVFKVQAGYVVFKISEIINAGVKKFDDVKNEVKTFVLREKKFIIAEKLIKDIKSKVGNDLYRSKEVYAKARYDTTGAFTTAGNIPKVGIEYNFSASAYKGELNKVIGPIKGQRGYYLVKVISRNNFDQNVFNMQRNQIRDNILQERKSQYIGQWLTKIKEDSEIKDNRHLFFGR